MANTLKIKRGTAATIPQGQLAEPLFTTDTYDLYIGKGSGGNQRFQKYIASGTSSQFLKGDGSLDSTTYQATSEKGANNGYASLDSGGKIPASQLPSSVIEYKGTWNASTNTPTLADGTGDAGDVYIVSVGGTQNLGSGSITFDAGDWVMYNGSIWQKSTGSNAVASVNGQTGIVSIGVNDLDDATITSVSNGQLLQYNTATNKWVNWTPTYISAAITSLNGLTGATQTFANDTNVIITSASSTHTIGWSGQLAIARGGTGLSSLGTSGQLLRVNSGATALEYFTPTYISAAITSLNGLTAATQTFATGSSGTDFNISSSTSTHTFNIPSASASNRGLVTTGTQTFAGDKTFSGSLNGLTAVFTGSVTTPAGFYIDLNTYLYEGILQLTDLVNKKNILKFTASTSGHYINSLFLTGGSQQPIYISAKSTAGQNVIFNTDGTTTFSHAISGTTAAFTSNSGNFNLGSQTDTAIYTHFGSKSASGGQAVAMRLAGTLTATANFDNLFGLWVDYTDNTAGYAGVTRYGIYQNDSAKRNYFGGPTTFNSAVTGSDTITATAFIPTGTSVPSRGMYTSASNVLDFSAGTTNLLSLNFNTGLSTFNTGVRGYYFRIVNVSTAEFGINTENNQGYIGTTTSHGFNIMTNNTARLTISSTGAATFSSNIQVGGAAIGGNSSAFYNTTTETSVAIKQTSGGSQIGLAIWNDATTGDNRFIRFFTETGASNRGSIHYDRTGNRLNIIGEGNGILFTGAATFSSSVTATGNAATTSSFYANNSSGSSGTSQYYIDFTAGATTIGRIFRGNGASNVVANGLNIDNFDGFQVRLNQLGGSGGTFNIMGGNVGIGTTSPTNPLHIQSNTVSQLNVTALSGNTNAQINLEPTGTGIALIGPANNVDFALRTNATERMRINAGGGLKIYNSAPTWTGDGLELNYNGTNSLIGSYDRSTSTYKQLYFYGSNTIFENGGSERMRITSGGNVLVGTTTDGTGKLQINGVVNIISGGGLAIGSVAGRRRIQHDDGLSEMSVLGNNDGYYPIAASAFNTRSDYRLKEDLKDINGLDKVSKIKVYNFKWKDSDNRMDGVLAHELEEILPYAVNGVKDAIREDKKIMPQGVDYSKLVPVLVKAIQEQQAQIEELKSKLN